MKYAVIDIEANALVNPDRVWLVVLKYSDGRYETFYDLTKKETERERLKRSIQILGESSHLLVGHNLLGYDWDILYPILEMDRKAILGYAVDTLIVSRLVDYSRQGHSIEDYGLEFGHEKIKFTDFSKFSPEMETYCKRDCDICEQIYLKYRKYTSNPDHQPSLALEHQFQLVVNDLHLAGFGFNSDRAGRLLDRVNAELETLDKDILEAFPPKLSLIREIHPKETKHGTLSRTDFRWVSDGDLSVFNGGPFSRCEWKPFNPSSHRQIISVLSRAGWQPVDKTKTHIDTEREYNLSKRQKSLKTSDELLQRLHELRVSGWKVNETNLETLPNNAPKAARVLAKRILLEARRRTLTEWLDLCDEGGRIHGRFYGIGAWTHRMAHQNPNTANIPNEYDTQGKKKLLGKELRSLWCAPKNRLLVGCDAEGIQLRIFAHYINDPEFTDSLVKGRKDDKTDPHSLNQRILGSACKSRDAAKRFIYALLLGAGINKLTEILGCSSSETEAALDRLLERYAGWATLKEQVFPKDARRGYFTGLDGRKVRIPGETEGTRRHLAMSGYLQNGEAVVMKLATMKWWSQLGDYNAKLVNFVHDEWQIEAPNDVDICIKLGYLMSNSLKEVGEDLKLNCPLAGSFWNDKLKDYTIGTNWSVTH